MQLRSMSAANRLRMVPEAAWSARFCRRCACSALAPHRAWMRGGGGAGRGGPGACGRPAEPSSVFVGGSLHEVALSFGARPAIPSFVLVQAYGDATPLLL